MNFGELLRFGASWFVRTVGVAFVVGTLLRFTLKDRLPGLSILHYMLPLPILIALGMFLALAFVFARRPRLGLCALIVATLLTGLWFGSSLHRAPWSGQPAELRVMFWNTARGRMGYGRVVRQIRRVDPDVACFLEAPRLAVILRENFPNKNVIGMGRDFACVSETPLQLLERGKLGPRGRYAEVDVIEHEVRLVITDVFSDPWRFRGPALEQVLQIAHRSGSRTILMGDFNTPFDSVHFDPYRESMRHAFAARGRGFIETWPLGLPLLAIDHVWVSRDVRVLRARHLSSWASDHAAVVLDVSFPPPPPALKNASWTPDS